MVMPSAASPAITNAAPARKSGALTLAPVYSLIPRMIAILLSTLILAPIRESSSTYLKRFSKILSVTVLVPSAMPRTTVICGCISVGNPGYGSVVICVWVNPLLATMRTASSNSSIIHPASISFADVASKCFGITFFIKTSPFVAAAAHIKVPASI